MQFEITGWRLSCGLKARLLQSLVRTPHGGRTSELSRQPVRPTAMRSGEHSGSPGAGFIGDPVQPVVGQLHYYPRQINGVQTERQSYDTDPPWTTEECEDC